ncbi:MarR family transcriptional regulator, protease production regulatory protein HPr [Alteribacillus persepolensis]|uniref:MarR family transcriptional regulator, protease production regulatory protein HPr n=1 Tax=Alteribacillus persepolensis TaxID=568899 RepID=A0A1G8DEH2_9BACI|nr:HTH-type transcriptional regulator Hpr [Alteribacillus persepolensis]SDH55984.1 MarR family transcriptional regulator, protease production regulatory protein HPr [Alteribacillus persepolensis]
MDQFEETKQSILFSHKFAQMTKALWKSVEKDWQQWIKPYHLNINEHQILWIAYHMEGASISDIAKFGVMHVSTAFNFSKKLEERGLLHFSKKTTDKRNTYIQLTAEGDKLLQETIKAYKPDTYHVYSGAMPIKELYGKFPDFSELMTILRHIYGEDFIKIFEQSLSTFNEEFTEKDGTLTPVKSVEK